MGITRDADAPFVPVADQDDLDRLFTASAEQPVVLFKHDFACGTSVRAYYELASMPGQIPLIDVARQKGLAADVAARTGIKHESPQVIVVSHGQPVYSASHGKIRRDDVTRAVSGQ